MRASDKRDTGEANGKRIAIALYVRAKSAITQTGSGGGP